VLPATPAKGIARRWFADGEALLAIDVPERGEAALDALQDAVLLGEFDTPLQRIARACGHDFDWRASERNAPLQMSAEAAPDGPEPFESTRSRPIGLALPDTLFERLTSAIDREEAGLHLTMHRRRCRVVLERLSLDSADRDRLRPGSLLLLPASCRTSWGIELVSDAGEPLRLAASVEAKSGNAIASMTQPPVLAVGECVVSLTTPIVIDIDRWTNGYRIDCHVIEGAPVTVELARSQERDAGGERSAASDTVTFEGTLVGLGRAHAVRLAPPRAQD